MTYVTRLVILFSFWMLIGGSPVSASEQVNATDPAGSRSGDSTGVVPGQSAVVEINDTMFNVRAFGAAGDGETLDSVAINHAIMAASEAGGGTVFFPSGTYLSFSIRLQSHVSLYLDSGATLLAAEPKTEDSGYDAPEPNIWGEKFEYQDFGHSHFRNSLIWGENLEDVSITGPGKIDGKGLWKGLYPPLGPAPGPNPGNKAIAIKSANNIILRDFTIFRGGHFGILATGINNLTIDGIKIDTNRDGIDIDACRNVRVANVVVNSPNDDAIVLKSSYVLGEAIATENVTITNSIVSGYDMGTMLDGTYQRTVKHAPDQDGPTGRVKFGTESNGGFKNITISNVVFDRSRGLALETVDGALIEDVAISNVTMRDVSSSPIFLRLGSRMRGPSDLSIGKLRRVTISNLVVYNADPRYPVIISGLPEHPVEAIRLSNIKIYYRGGLSMGEAGQQPEELVNTFFIDKKNGLRARDPYDVPERARAYPEPSMFGILPAYGFYIRHVDGIELDNVDVHFISEDKRPPFVLQNVDAVDFIGGKADRAPGTPTFVLRDVSRFSVSRSKNVPDTSMDRAENESL